MCGIFAYSGKHPNIDKIKILGLYNQSRGEDACGLLINSKVMHGNGTQKKFASFIENNELPEPTKQHTIIGHTRKSSSGGVSEQFTHPYNITNPKGKSLLVGVHNGTLTNWVALAKKYDVNITDKNDSKTLFTILSLDKKNIKVLEEYVGGAALLINNPTEKNSLYVFKGGSKTYYQSKVETPEDEAKWEEYYGKDFYTVEKESMSKVKEERPLYMYRESEGSVYFSSLEESLYAIGGNITNIFPVPLNKLLKFIDGELVEITDINRNIEEEAYDVWTNPKTAVGFNYGHNATKNIIGTKGIVVPTSGKSINTDYIPDNSFIHLSNYIYFYRGAYYKSGNIVPNGIYNVNLTNGKVYDTITQDSIEMAFVKGNILLFVEDYEEACNAPSLLELSKYTISPITIDYGGINFGLNGKKTFSLTYTPLFLRTMDLRIEEGTLKSFTSPVEHTASIKTPLLIPTKIECNICEDTGITEENENCWKCQKGMDLTNREDLLNNYHIESWERARKPTQNVITGNLYKSNINNTLITDLELDLAIGISSMDKQINTLSKLVRELCE